MERICVGCKGPIPGGKRSDAKYCSRECGQKVRRSRWRKKPGSDAKEKASKDAYGARKEVERDHARTQANANHPPCPVCKADMRGCNPRKIYCSDYCAYRNWYINHRDEQIERLAAYRRGKGPVYYARMARKNYLLRLIRVPGEAETLRHKARRTYRQDPARGRRNATRWRLTHKEERKEYRDRRRARSLGAGVNHFAAKDWRRLKARYRHCCAYCGQYAEILHKDHVIPLSRGGRHSIGNILPSCGSCNHRKSSSYIMEWRMREIRYARFLNGGIAS